MIRAILACDNNGGIGNDGRIPWPHIKRDFEWFMDQTLDSVMVMGRITWMDSQLNHPIPNRLSYVVTRNPEVCSSADGVITGDINSEILKLQESFPESTIWIIGGVGLITLTLPIIEEFYLSRIPGAYDCDRFLPIDQLEKWDLSFEEIFDDVTFQILRNPLR